MTDKKSDRVERGHQPNPRVVIQEGHQPVATQKPLGPPPNQNSGGNKKE